MNKYSFIRLLLILALALLIPIGLVASWDGRLYFHDADTGTLVRSVDLFRSVHWVNCICGMAFLAWCVLWSRFSRKMHTQGWVDLLAFTMPILGYMLMSLHDQVGGSISLPAICMVRFGVCLGLTLLASIWCAIGGARWSLGVLPLALCISFSILGFSYSYSAIGGTRPQRLLCV